MAIDEAQLRGRQPSDDATAQDAATQAKEQVQQKADEMKGQAGRRVREQLDTRSTAAGAQAASLATALHKAAQQLEQDGNTGGARAAHQAAHHVDRLAGYLTDSSSDRLLADLERFGRTRPWAAGAVGAALGFVGARFLKASSESRYDASARTRRDADLPIRRDEDSIGSFAVLEVREHGRP